ncbi:MAG: hypothetical protein ABSF14_22930 [Terriglobia bacterium]
MDAVRFRKMPAFPMLVMGLVFGIGGNGTTATSSGHWASRVPLLGNVLLVPVPGVAQARQR